MARTDSSLNLHFTTQLMALTDPDTILRRMKVFAGTFIFRPKTIHFWGGVRLCGQVHGVKSDAGRRPIARSRRASRAHVRPHAAQQRPRAPGGVKRALTDSTTIYMRLCPTYAPPGQPKAAAHARPHLLQRARAARIACPTPGVTRDPPAQAPTGTFRPVG